MIELGIDPGRYGAIALLDGKHFLEVHDCPVDDDGKIVMESLGRLIGDIHVRYRDVGLRATIEEAGIFRGKRQGSGGMAKYLANFGAWQGALAANGIPAQVVAQRTWKAAYKLNKNKAASIRVAKLLFPSATTAIDGPNAEGRRLAQNRDGRAEAILLADYGASVWKRKSLLERSQSSCKPSTAARKPA